MNMTNRNYFKKTWHLIDNYLIARWQNRPSTALFWYLPESAALKSTEDLLRYQTIERVPCYLMDYRQKLRYSLQNDHGIIVLPYQGSIGKQVNPEASFQYALGLHDQFALTNTPQHIDKFWQYVDYFLSKQTRDGLWSYDFDWYGSNAPWYSALAQSRGASVMLRAWLHSRRSIYLEASKKALMKFTVSTSEGGFLHIFKPSNCAYFEEYPMTPTGVLNGFMASLMSIWEVRYWSPEKWLDDLWELGIASLELMIPYYSNGWWSLYDLDNHSPILNVNSPRYHLLEIEYLQILSILSKSCILQTEYDRRVKQYKNPLFRMKALCLKGTRKVFYR